MKICAVVPMFGFPEVTNKCIKFTSQNAGVDCDILIVDDASPEPFHNDADNVFVLRLEKNLGFTGATNAGMLWALDHKYDYVLFLNNDTEPEPDFLKLLLEALEKHTDLGIAASSRKITMKDGKPWIENFGIDLIMGYQAYTDTDLDKEVVRVAWLPICSALIATDTIRQVGLLDKRMRMYCSDNDYCIRLQELGYRVGLVPKSKIKHLHQMTTHSINNIYSDADRDQKVLLEKLCCHLQRQLLDTYPLDWHAKTWGKLEFFIYTKDKEPNFMEQEEDDQLNQPATAELTGR